MAYLTREALKRYLGIAAADTGEDDLLDDLLVDVQAAIDGYCDRTFEADTDETRTFRYRESVVGRLLMLEGEVCQVSGITNGDVAGMLIGGGAYTLLPLSGPPYTGIELHEDAGVAWEGDIEVTGRWAYSVSAPQGIVHAMREYVAYLYRAYDRQGVANGQDFDIGLPEHLRQLLVRYQRIA